MEIFIASIIGYFMGCFQTSFILGKFFKHIDIRQYGSGNAGSTNAIRVMGPVYGIITFIGDAGKSILAYMIGIHYFESPHIAFIMGFFVVVGHNWPVFLKFKGGKGIASTIGLVLAFDYRLGLTLMLIGFIVAFITKYVSVGSITLSLTLPISLLLMKQDILIIGLASILLIFAVYRHRTNITRIINGTEAKIK